MRLLTLVRGFALLALCPGLLAMPSAPKSGLAAREDFQAADSISEGLVEDSYEPDSTTDQGFDEQADEDEESEDTSDALHGTFNPEVAETEDDYDALEGTSELDDNDSEAFPETSEDTLEDTEASDASQDSTEPEDESEASVEISDEQAKDIEVFNSAALATMAASSPFPLMPGGPNCFSDADRALMKWRRKCDVTSGIAAQHMGCMAYAPSRKICCKSPGKRNLAAFHHGLVSNCVAYHFWPQNDQQRHMCSVNCDENALEPWCNYGDDPKVNNPWKWCSCAHVECVKDWGKILPDKNAKCYRWDHQQSAPYFSAECKMQEGGNTTWPNGNAS